jgi:hypothetical protein
MRRRTAVLLAMLAALSSSMTAPINSNAEWVQIPIGVPRAPGCNAGYSWQKSGNRYQCMTPPPSCALGFAAGPTWNGSSWTYVCNSPPQDPPVRPQDPVINCSVAMSARGFYDFSQFEELRNFAPPKRTFSWTAHGPYTSPEDSCGDPTHLYIMYCVVNPDSTVASVDFMPQAENITCGGQGG